MTFRINRVYTRSGDDGHTGLVSGKRVLKSDARVQAYGEVDELNSVLGCLKEELPADDSLRPLIEFLQQGLFDLGGELATPADGEYAGMWKASDANVKVFEELCDRYGDSLPELTSFILPGGNKTASWFHLARSTARRAERALVGLAQNPEEKVNPFAIQYLNRLSDLLFILARHALARAGDDAPLWVQEKNRKVPA